MSAPDLDLIRERLAASTPGPWLPETGSMEEIAAIHHWPTEAEWKADESAAMAVLEARHSICTMNGWPPDSWRANATFIAHAPEDIADLLALVDRYRDVIAALEAEVAERSEARTNRYGRVGGFDRCGQPDPEGLDR